MARNTNTPKPQLEDTELERDQSNEMETVSASEVEEPTDLRTFAAQVKHEAFKTKVVTITSNDKRDNDIATTAILTCENQYFAISRIVPLGVPVEIEKCLIDSAKDVLIPIHVDEVINGRRTGNATVQMINKYNISYEEQ